MNSWVKAQVTQKQVEECMHM